MNAPAPDEHPLLAHLNETQREAVRTVQGPVLILAGAGSGKTRVICHRLAWLIEHGADPQGILAVTFTNKAAAEMKSRVKDLTGLATQSLWVMTFHSAAARMLRQDITHLGRSRGFTICDSADSTALIKSIVKEMGLDPKMEKPDDIADLISRAKDDLLTPDRWIEQTRMNRARAERVHAIYSAYQKRLVQSNALDFGDLIGEAVRLLEIPAVQERYRERFQHVLVDEYQDTNHAQYRLIRLLAPDPFSNICVVGDDDQAIYGWRGADVANIYSFERDYPRARVIELYDNYRSTQQILDAASTLINENSRRMRPKKLKAHREGGDPPEVIGAVNEYDEMEKVIARIERNRRAGAGYLDHAIFYRVNAQSRVAEEMLSASGIPYQLLNGVSFYQRAEIKDVTAYLKLIANPRDDVSFRRVINNPPRGIGDTTVAALVAAAGDESLMAVAAQPEKLPEVKKATLLRLRQFLDLVTELTEYAAKNGAAELIRRVLDRTRYCDQYDPSDPEDESRVENVREFLSAAEEFQSSNEDPSLAAFLERISLTTDIDSFDPDRDAVVLSTLHSTKGREYTHVFIIGCENSLLPHARVFDSNRIDDLEEERRLAYVGFTRARKSLTLSCAAERRIYGKMVNNIASQFLEEAGLKVRLPAARTSPVVSSWIRPAPRPAYRQAERPAPAAMPALERVVAPPPATGRTGILSEGDTVTHRKFGKGKVIYVAESGDENEVVQVRFASGVKSLMSRYANLEKV